MPAPRRLSWFNEFTVLGAFVAVALFGIIYGAVLVVGAVRDQVQTAAAAPSVDAFRSALAEAAAPFLSQASTSGGDMFTGDTTLAAAFAAKTRDQVLAVDDVVRVPTSEADGYLALVLLLDRWNRAFAPNASVASRASVVADTRAYVLVRPWMVTDVP